MQLEINRYERVAGIFVLGALIGVLAVTAGLIIRTGYFSSKVAYYTYLESANGINTGTRVQMAGLNVGWVEDVELVAPNKVSITLEVLEKYAPRLREGTVVQVVRPYVLGDKAIELRAGPDDKPQLEAGAEIPNLESFDIVDLLSGRTLGPFVANIERMVDDLNQFLAGISENEDTATLVELLDQVGPLITNVNAMAREMSISAREMNRNQRFVTLVEGMTESTQAMNDILPEIRKSAPEMSKRLPVIMENMEVLTTELRALTPALAEVAPDLPRTSRRAVEAIDEAVILMKALQKSFMLRGNVKEVLKEEDASGQ